MRETSNETDLESQEFREALLSQLNGQTEDMQRLIKLIDTRFQSHSRRLRELRHWHRDQEELRERKRRDMERRLAALLTAVAGLVTGLPEIVRVLL